MAITLVPRTFHGIQPGLSEAITIRTSRGRLREMASPSTRMDKRTIFLSGYTQQAFVVENDEMDTHRRDIEK